MRRSGPLDRTSKGRISAFGVGAGAVRMSQAARRSRLGSEINHLEAAVVGAGGAVLRYGVGDGGGKARALANGVFGADNVARVLASIFPLLAKIDATVEPRDVNGQPGQSCAIGTAGWRAR